MFIKIKSAAVLGLDCASIDVEVDLAGSWPGFQIVGLPDTSIQEAKERIRTAWKNSALQFPSNGRIVINLAPADVRKEGSSYDLPMAVGMYIVAEKINTEKLCLDKSLFLGELALDGSLRHINGVLPFAIFAAKNNYQKIFVPEINAKEAALIKNIEIYPVQNFRQVVDHLSGKKLIEIQ